MSNQLGPGQQLLRGQQLNSANNQFAFILQDDGNLVLYKGSKALWSSKTDNVAVKVCIMQDDGNLVLYRYDGKAAWSSHTAGKAGSRLVVQNDGNVVIYHDPAPQAVWATDTNE